MTEKLRYVVDEQGEQVAVLLDLAEYHRLAGQMTADPELLLGLSQEELQALADSTLAPAAQTRLNDLLVRHKAQELSDEEMSALDQLLAQVDQLNILKTRARYTLKQFQAISSTS